jgi:hypothetical protein
MLMTESKSLEAVKIACDNNIHKAEGEARSEVLVTA